ncbi:pirin family protein [candidate division KSB1 bacterium]|nr:pirin family protein [candidate division KSB1 bacterium]
MIQKIEADKRYFSDIGWLQTYWLFSFGNYYDPANVNFGSLRVFNDDIIAPNTGFDTHPHKEMEIVSIIFEGQLNHKDSMGNEEVIRAGEVQRMTAGTGIMHSEHNYGEVPTNLYQLWILPNQSGLKPSYEQKIFSSESKKNTLLPVVSNKENNGALFIHSDTTIFLSELDKGKEITYDTDESRNIFIYLNNGKLSINGEEFCTKDQARITNETQVKISADENSSFICIDVQDLPGN